MSRGRSTRTLEASCWRCSRRRWPAAPAYIGSLTALLITAFYVTDSFTTQIVKEFTLQNFSDLFSPTYRTVAFRTILVAATVTVIDFVIAMPMAFTLAKSSPIAPGGCCSCSS